jgi:hypothetical protein
VGEVVAAANATVVVATATGDHPAIQMKKRRATPSPPMCVGLVANLATEQRNADPNQRRQPKPMSHTKMKAACCWRRQSKYFFPQSSCDGDGASTGDSARQAGCCSPHRGACLHTDCGGGRSGQLVMMGHRHRGHQLHDWCMRCLRRARHRHQWCTLMGAEPSSLQQQEW